MNNIFTLLAGILVSCGLANAPGPFYGHSTTFTNEQRQAFEERFDLVIEYPIYEMPHLNCPFNDCPTVVGMCFYGPEKRVEILASEVHQHPAEASLALFHEFGHCSMGLKHNDRYTNIMNSHISIANFLMWIEHRDLMLDDLQMQYEGLGPK